MTENTLWKTASDLAETRPSRRQPRPEEEVQRTQLELLLHRARTAPNGDEAMEYVQRAVDLLPDDPRVQSTVQLSLFQKLRSDAFLAFLAETEQHYVIRFRNSRPFSVPKARALAESYPPSARRTEAEQALRMMWWMILGLVPAGLGAVILSPVALWHALRALQSDTLDLRQRRMAWTAILVALLLGMLGAFFSALLVLHILIS